jgi:putative RecB family exonuclease
MSADLRQTIGDDLYTSISQIKSWMLCPRQFEFHYVRGLDPEMVPKALAFGTVFHSALARYYSELRDNGTPPAAEVLVQTFSDLWRQKLEGKIPIEGADDEEEDGKTDPVDLGAKMLRKFHEHASHSTDVKVEAVEMPFSVTLYDPDSGEVQEEKLVGVLDLAVREDGNLIIVEHKTSSKKYAQDKLRYDFQPTAYQLALKEQGWQPEQLGLRFQVVTKTKCPQVQIEDVVRSSEDEDDFRRIALGVLKAIDAGVSYPVRGWQCKSCPYKRACSKRSKG